MKFSKAPIQDCYWEQCLCLRKWC